MVSIPRFGGPPRIAPPEASAQFDTSPRGRTLPTGWALLRERLSRLTVMSAALFLLGGVGLVQVLQTTQIAATGYEVRALELERASLDADIRLLEAQIATTSNLEQIRSEATKRLGMVPAQRSVRVAVETPAPALIPLPKRYMPVRDDAPARSAAWWERIQGHIPGLH